MRKKLGKINFVGDLAPCASARPIKKFSITNDSGVILVSVLVMSLLAMVLAVTVYSINVSQVSASQRQIDRIKVQQLVLGQHWRNYMSQVNGGGAVAPLSVSLTEQHRGITTLPKTFTISVVNLGPGPLTLSNTTGYRFDSNNY